MIRVTYESFCDICGASDEPVSINVGVHDLLPRPSPGVVLNGSMVCQTCAELAVPAMNDALKDRLKVKEH